MTILKKGIDVSYCQKAIDWQKVKNAGIEFAILRSSYGSPDPSQIDTTFYQNVKGCQAVGMPIGAYHYGYAVSVKQAKDEASFFLDTIKGIKFDYPVYYDAEDDNTMGRLSKQELTDVINAFCKVIADAGYKIGVYSSKFWLENKIDVNQISYPIWCSQYYQECTYNGIYQIWQYSSTGRVDGIDAPCDMDYAYVDYTLSNQVSNKSVDVPVNTVVTNQVVNVTYKVRTQHRNWLPEVTNLNDFAGITNDPITDIAVKVSVGNVKYRVHIKGGDWLSYVTGYNVNDSNNGYAGEGKIIDAVEIYYSTPSNIRPYKCAKYHVSPVGDNYYSWQYDDQKSNNQDGYAGCFGKVIDKIQIVIE